VAAAKKEGTVTCYCWDFRTTWKSDWAIKNFKAAYGIDLEIQAFSGTVSTERIKTEARAGKYVADVFDAMLSYHTGTMEPTGLLKRIDNLPALKDAKDPDLFYYSPIVTPYTLEGPNEMKVPGTHGTYNTNLIPPDRLPKKWADLLDPYYKQKICESDPITYAGIDYAIWGHFRELGYPDWWLDFTYDYYGKHNSIHFLGILGGPSPIQRGECGLSVAWGGGGTWSVKVTNTIDKATWIKGWSMTDQMYPIRFNGGYGFGLLAKSPHPNAATVFMNWYFSKEGMTSYSKLALDPVRRKDIPNLVEKEYSPAKTVSTYWVPEPEFYSFEQYSYSTKGLFNLMKQGMSRDAWKKWMKDTSMNFWGQYPPPPTTLYTAE